MKCKHKNITIRESARAHINHMFEDGEYRISDHYIGLEFNTLRVVCADCGLTKDYSKYHLPKWLSEKWDEVVK